MATIDLKTTREEQGFTLAAIYERTRIAVRYLEAIEEGKFALLPPPVYTRQFIRAYARFLGLDPEPVSAEYELYLESLREPSQVISPSEEKTGLLIGKMRFRLRNRVIPALLGITVSAVVFGLVLLDTGVYQRVASWFASPGLNIDSPADKFPEKVSPLETPAPRTLPPEEPPSYHLVIRARELTWLRIRVDRDPPSQVLLNPGEQVERFAQKNLVLDIGNAGGIDLIFQGKNLGAPGKSGEVVHLKLP